jgi:hypothetical protein
MAQTTKPNIPTMLEKKATKTPRERFTSIGAKRVGKVLKALNNLLPVANKNAYEFTASDVSKMNVAIDERVTAVKAVFSAALEGKSATKETGGFSF